MKLNKSKGQVVLILVLLTVFGLTIGPSLISRTITDIRISSQIEESGKAFSGAEAAIESALKTGQAVPDVDAVKPTYSLVLPSVEANYIIGALGGGMELFEYPETLPGESQVLWFMDHDNTDGSLDEAASSFPLGNPFDVCWTMNAGLSLTLFYKDDQGYKISKKAYLYTGADAAPTPAGNPSGNSFLAPGLTQDTDICKNTDPAYRFIITLNSDNKFWSGPSDPVLTAPGLKLIYMVMQPFYSLTKIAVKSSSVSLPAQGKQIISEGKTGSGIVRKIRVVQGFYTLPEVFNYALFGE